MKKEVFLALVTSIIEDTINNLELPTGPRGRRGLRGSEGKGFHLEEHLESIQNILSDEVESRKDELKLKFSDLSEEEILSLRGRDGKSPRIGEILPSIVDYLEDNKESFSVKFDSLTVEQLDLIRGEKGARGQRGKPGEDGKDGKDFNLQENLDLVKELLEELKPKISDLTEEEIVLLQGPVGEKGARGQRGRPGLDFNFTEEKDNVKNLILENKEELTPKISDLSEEELELIKGPVGEKGARGQRGKPGQFNFEAERHNVLSLLLENRNEIKLKYSDLTPEEVTELKLKFKDLSDEEKDSLKLKYSDLTEEELFNLQGPKGARGQRGKQGVQGETGKDGAIGPMGPRGILGPTGTTGARGSDGRDGRDGQDGKDAPTIVDVEVIQVSKDKIYFVYEFSDGSSLETSIIEIPTNMESYYSFGGGGGGSGSSGGSTWHNGSGVPGAGLGSDGDYYIDNDTGDYYEKVAGAWNLVGNLEGPTGPTGPQGPQGDPASVSWYDEGVLVGLLGNVNFTGAGVTVTENPVGTLEVNIPGGGGAACLEVEDEYDPVTNCAKSINFIGDNVTVRPRVYMSAWPTMDDVLPSLSDYEGVGGNPEDVDVYIDFSDPSIITDVDCDPTVYIGSFVRMNGAGVALNALADSLANSNVLGLVESKESSTKCTIRVAGRSGALFAGLDPTKDYFLSETTPGAIQTTIPSNTGEVWLKLGQPFSSTSFFYNKGERTERL